MTKKENRLPWKFLLHTCSQPMYILRDNTKTIFFSKKPQLPALLRRLAADGYAGWLSMETHYRLDSHLTEEQMRLPGGAGFSAGGAAATAESVAALKDILQKEGLL